MRHPDNKCTCSDVETCPIHDNAALWFVFVVIVQIVVLSGVIALVWSYL